MEDAGPAGTPGRVVLLAGEAARQRAALLMRIMRQAGCQPAVVAALSGEHLSETLTRAVARVRCAHAPPGPVLYAPEPCTLSPDCAR